MNSKSMNNLEIKTLNSIKFKLLKHYNKNKIFNTFILFVHFFVVGNFVTYNGHFYFSLLNLLFTQ
jgi:hypothetical protein